jgi:hypothetical protein
MTPYDLASDIHPTLVEASSLDIPRDIRQARIHGERSSAVLQPNDAAHEADAFRWQGLTLVHFPRTLNPVSAFEKECLKDLV